MRGHMRYLFLEGYGDKHLWVIGVFVSPHTPQPGIRCVYELVVVQQPV